VHQLDMKLTKIKFSSEVFKPFATVSFDAFFDNAAGFIGLVFASRKTQNKYRNQN
jgi:hypothetical protein